MSRCKSLRGRTGGQPSTPGAQGPTRVSGELVHAVLGPWDVTAPVQGGGVGPTPACPQGTQCGREQGVWAGQDHSLPKRPRWAGGSLCPCARPCATFLTFIISSNLTSLCHVGVTPQQGQTWAVAGLHSRGAGLDRTPGTVTDGPGKLETGSGTSHLSRECRAPHPPRDGHGNETQTLRP